MDSVCNTSLLLQYVLSTVVHVVLYTVLPVYIITVLRCFLLLADPWRRSAEVGGPDKEQITSNLY